MRVAARREAPPPLAWSQPAQRQELSARERSSPVQEEEKPSQQQHLREAEVHWQELL